MCKAEMGYQQSNRKQTKNEFYRRKRNWEKWEKEVITENKMTKNREIHTQWEYQ